MAVVIATFFVGYIDFAQNSLRSSRGGQRPFLRGPVTQLARVSPWHGGSQGFESPQVHNWKLQIINPK